MDVFDLQARLLGQGFSPGMDGQLSGATLGALFAYVGSRPPGDALTAAMGASAAEHFPTYAIDTPLRIAHFLAQGAVETGGYKRLEENLSYSAQRLTQVWPRRFPTLAAAQACANNAEALANQVYADRIGNGPTASGDGWRFRGRGLLQLTGRANYAQAEKDTGVAVVAHPDYAADPGLSVQIACAYWGLKAINGLADADDLTGVRQKVNGGQTGINEARTYLDKAKHVLMPG